MGNFDSLPLDSDKNSSFLCAGIFLRSTRHSITTSFTSSGKLLTISYWRPNILLEWNRYSDIFLFHYTKVFAGEMIQRLLVTSFLRNSVSFRRDWFTGYSFFPQAWRSRISLPAIKSKVNEIQKYLPKQSFFPPFFCIPFSPQILTQPCFKILPEQ